MSKLFSNSTNMKWRIDLNQSDYEKSHELLIAHNRLTLKLNNDIPLQKKGINFVGINYGIHDT